MSANVNPVPPLIALPGTLLDGRGLAALLHGFDARTEVLGAASHIDDETDRLVALAAQSRHRRGLGRGPFVWLGHSLGGIVALHLASRHPQHVAGLVLLGANARAGRDSSQTRRDSQTSWPMPRNARACSRPGRR